MVITVLSQICMFFFVKRYILCETPFLGHPIQCQLKPDTMFYLAELTISALVHCM